MVSRKSILILILHETCEMEAIDKHDDTPNNVECWRKARDNFKCNSTTYKIGLTKEPSEWFCLIEPPSVFGLLKEPPLLWITALILFTHSTLSAMLSAFNTTAPWAAKFNKKICNK
jgi:hypothetical protein